MHIKRKDTRLDMSFLYFLRETIIEIFRDWGKSLLFVLVYCIIKFAMRYEDEYLGKVFGFVLMISLVALVYIILKNIF